MTQVKWKRRVLTLWLALRLVLVPVRQSPATSDGISAEPGVFLTWVQLSWTSSGDN